MSDNLNGNKATKRATALTVAQAGLELAVGNTSQ